MKHLFKEWNKLESAFLNKTIALFLDFDGTLTPIVETPDKAVLPLKTKRLLRKLIKNPKFKLAIISGRALFDLKNKVGLRNIVYVGNHGLEIEGPKIKFDPSIPLRVNPEHGRRIESPVSSRYKRLLEHIKNKIEEKLFAIKGVFIEDKGLTLSIHYRLARINQIPKIKNILQEALIPYLGKDIKIKLGKKIFEIQPAVEWDKGKVVLWLLARWKFAFNDKDILPIYLGDDLTDEDAFRALEDKGITVFIGRPKKSIARYYLKDTKEVMDFLKRISQYAIKESTRCRN